MTVRPWTRIPVLYPQRGGRRAWRCRLGWHRVRFIKDQDYAPLCTRCWGVARWWMREQGHAG